MAGFAPVKTVGKKSIRTVGKRTSQGIGVGTRCRPKHKNARRSWKRYRGQGRP